MAGGLVGLLDDVAALAKLAAASLDDIGVAAGKASVKAAGVVVDDTAVTPAYVHGLASERELPIIRRIASGSLRNKLLFILPAGLVLSAVVPVLVEVLLMCGGAYLAYEGAHKIRHRGEAHSSDSGEERDSADGRNDRVLPAAAIDTEHEDHLVRGAVRTDLILSAEIMIIALKDVLEKPLIERALVLIVVAFLITIVVYGAVALIVKMDDVGLAMAQSRRAASVTVGRALVAGMPRLLAALSVVGTAAMVWVGGHILLAGAAELGWHTPYDAVHRLESTVGDIAAVGGVLGWMLNTAASALVGLAVGFAVAAFAPVVGRLVPRRS